MARDYEDYERGEELKAMGENALANLRAILANSSADNVADLARGVYKYTDCGAMLGALLYRGEDNPGQWVYGTDLRTIAPDEFITALSVSSIVEGVEQTTETHIIDLFDDAFESPEQCAQAYSSALQSVEDEASAIWNESHGCPTCAKHFGNVASNGIETCEGDDGMTPVWSDCPDCGGNGSCI
jgi:hypothetical protein